MKKPILAAVALLLCSVGAIAQAKPKPTPNKVSGPSRKIVFAVLNDGKTIEPIGYVSSKGALSETVNGSGEAAALKSFSNSYFKKGTSYALVFGGTNSGTVTVKSSNVGTECAKNTADVTTKGANLKGLVMGLATNLATKSPASTRRKPTAGEKTAADALAKAEFAKEKLTPQTLHFQNLTAINVGGANGDTLVASYWIDIDAKTRGLLFYIATKGSNGKYTVSYREYRKVDQADVMSGNISAVDEGIYHELLLDYLDINGDGVAEIFTYQQGFEGAGFTAFERKAGRWQKAYEFNNYHCGF
jgi:hypothetical protein